MSRGKIACVTGAGRGIGRELAVHLLESGYKLACCSRTPGDLESLRALAGPGRAFCAPVDVSSRGEVMRFRDAVAEEFGALDLLVLNAGITGKDSTVAEGDPDEWERIVRVNLFGAYYAAKYFIPLLSRADGGKIILVGSGLGRRGAAKASAYSCSKAALSMLKNVLCEELADTGISVNELIPGPVNTGIDDGLKKRHSSVGFGNEWYKEPADVLPLFDFLISFGKTGPTGQTFSLARRVL